MRDSTPRNSTQVSGGSSAAVAALDGPLLIVDGHSLCFRALHAVPDTLVDAAGQPVGVIQGFMSMLLGLIESRSPASIVVCFDAGRDVRRTELYPEYKATRPSASPTLRPQVARLGELLDHLGILRLALEGVEADDVIATVAREAVERGAAVEIVSGDRDLLQLVSPQVTVLAPGRSMRELSVMTPEAVRAKYAVDPASYVAFAALRGDVSDNLPGVPGVGPKTAASLLDRFGTLDALVAALDEVTPVRVREAIQAAWPAVERNRLMMVALDTVPLPVEDLVVPLDLSRTGAAAVWCRDAGLQQVASRLEQLGR